MKVSSAENSYNTQELWISLLSNAFLKVILIMEQQTPLKTIEKQPYVSKIYFINLKGLLCTIWSLYPDKFDKPMENFDFDHGNSKARLFMHLKNT